MANKQVKTTISKQVGPHLKSYTVDEILAAGGATALANQLRKKPEHIRSELRKLTEDSYLTEDELQEALKLLTNK